MAGAFSRLPLEVLLIILRDTPDLPSLYKFVCASARVNEAFEFDAAPILDEVINRSIPHFKHLARMIGIMGSLSNQAGPDTQPLRPSLHPLLGPSSNLNFNAFGAKLNSLPEDVLSTALPSYAFAARTPGPRYLLLTAYRIEHLFHICFVTLLQNVHELIFFKSKPAPYYKSSRPGVFFEPVAWWPPSWVERFRIERALWKLFIYWNVRAIHNELTDDPTFRQYADLIQSIPTIGPKMKNYFNSNEVEEINCISAALYEFLGRSPFKFFSDLSSQERKLNIKKASSRFPLILQQTSYWKFETPKQGRRHIDFVSEFNSTYRRFFWTRWESYSRQSKFEFDKKGFWFPDYLGLCLWDVQRQVYLGLEYQTKKSDTGAEWVQRDPTFFTSTSMHMRWRDMFLEELVRLPGGRRRWVVGEFYKHVMRWNHEIASSDPRFDLWKPDMHKYGKKLKVILAASS